VIDFHTITSMPAKPLILLRDQTGGFNTNCTVTPIDEGALLAHNGKVAVYSQYFLKLFWGFA
jgi:hypothetical protein